MKVKFYGNELLSFLLKQIIDFEIINKEEIKVGSDENVLISDDYIFKVRSDELSNYRKILILSDKIDTRFFKENKKNNKITYLKKEEYVDIKEILQEKKKEELDIESKVILSDVGDEVYIKLKDISYFSYDRLQKKSFVVVKGEKKYLRKNLMELEEILPKSLFERVERGIILNLSLIKEIDYREEFIIMQDDEKIYLGKNILKKIKELVAEEYYIL